MGTYAGEQADSQTGSQILLHTGTQKGSAETEQFGSISEQLNALLRVSTIHLQDLLADVLAQIHARNLTGPFNRAVVTPARLEALKELLDDYWDDCDEDADDAKEATGLAAETDTQKMDEKKKRRKYLYPEGRRKTPCKEREALLKKHMLAKRFNLNAANENIKCPADIRGKLDLVLEILGALRTLEGSGMKVVEVHKGFTLPAQLAV